VPKKTEPHVADLSREVCEHARDAVELFTEYHDAAACAGSGTHRDPIGLLTELGEVLDALHAAAIEVQDEVERTERGVSG
jgi:hypothetical protein